MKSHLLLINSFVMSCIISNDTIEDGVEHVEEFVPNHHLVSSLSRHHFYSPNMGSYQVVLSRKRHGARVCGTLVKPHRLDVHPICLRRPGRYKALPGTQPELGLDISSLSGKIVNRPQPLVGLRGFEDFRTAKYRALRPMEFDGHNCVKLQVSPTDLLHQG